MKIFEKRSVAAVVMVLAIVAGVLLGQARKPDGTTAPFTAVVGTYTYDMAMTRAATATHMAREQQFPLRITVEQA